MSSAALVVAHAVDYLDFRPDPSVYGVGATRGTTVEADVFEVTLEMNIQGFGPLAAQASSGPTRRTC